MLAIRLVHASVLGITVIPAVAGRAALAGEDSTIRPAYHAGTWYPGDAATLAKQIDELLAAAPPPTSSARPIAIIAPHAGYRFSAPVAAAGYRWLRGQHYGRVIVLAFSHRNAGGYQGADVPRALTAYRTPLGDVPIDRAVCDQLLRQEHFASHPNVDEGEHSLELQLPLLQRTLGDFQLVPLLVGRMSAQDYAQVAKAILPLLDGDTLLVASSDFTHHGRRYGYEPFKNDIPERLKKRADAAAKPIERCDFDGFVDHLEKTHDTICGRGPITLLLRILSMQGGATGVRARMDTSGNITGDWTNSVTYQSFVFTRRAGTLGARARHELLQLARRTVEAELNGAGPTPNDAQQVSDDARREGACFVTLKNHGRLRGCIGNMVATGPLDEAVVRNAVLACHDRRFVSHPVTAAEVNDLDIKISYLTPMKLVKNIDDIIIGRHGLHISLGRWRGVLLPQVPYERGWTRETFLSQTCAKAGLPPDAWKRPDAVLHSFEAEVFGELQSEPMQSNDTH